MNTNKFHLATVFMTIFLFILSSQAYSQKTKIKTETEYTLQLNEKKYHKLIFRKDKYEYFVYNKNRSSKALQMVNGQIRHVQNELVLFYPDGKVYKKMRITKKGVIVDKVFLFKKREYHPE